MSDDWEGRHHDHSTEVDPSWAVAQLVARNYTLAAILTDLIAELRDHAVYASSELDQLRQLISDAQQLLRELGGDDE